MLINLKVKTLDSQTHEFEVDNEITVREFKDKIAERTSISADQQRIIYCGRVLADDKHLNEYDLNGKVVHVAERPPPSQRAASGSSNNDEGNTTRDRSTGRGGMRNSPLFRALDGMVVGTMAIPMNASAMSNPTVHATGGVNPFASSSSFCMNRITVARHMLECANNIAAYLEDPSRGLNNTSLDILARGRWTMESTVVEVGITAGDLPQNQNIVDMVQGAVSAALRRNGNTNVTVLQLPTVFGSNEDGMGESAAGIIIEEPLDDANMDNSSSTSANNSQAQVTIEDLGTEEDEENPFNSTAGSSSSSASASAGAANTGNNVAGNSTSTGTNTDDNNAPRRTGTASLAEVIEQMRNVQTRLNPFIEQFYDLLQNEPQFEADDNTGRENAQRLYDRVSEAFHYMSHAQHAISDLMLDVSQPTPRYLTCRPILVEQSGYVSNNYLSAAAAAAAAAAGMRPPAADAQATRSSGNNAGNAATATATPISARNNSQLPTATATSSAATGTAVEDPVDDPVVAPNIPRNVNVGTQSNDHQAQMARLIESIVNSTPIETEFTVQINAPAIVPIALPMGNVNVAGGGVNAAAMNAAASIAAQLHLAGANSSSSNSNTAPSNDNAATATPTGNTATTTTDNAAATAASEENNSSNTSSASATPAPAAAAPNNQAHVTTATLPTTSTQTRSTARPQLQMGSGWNGRFIPNNMMSSFDRFLPCNSHHIREPSDNAANGANNNNNNNSASNAPYRGGNAAGGVPHVHHRHHNFGAIPANARTMRILSDLNRRVRRPVRRNAVGSTMTVTPPGRAAGIAIPANALYNNSFLRIPYRAGSGQQQPQQPAQQRTPASANNSSNTASGNNNNSSSSSSSTSSNSSFTSSDRNLRHQLTQFMNQRLFLGASINTESTATAVDRAVQWLGESLLYLPQYEKPEYDARDSVFNILRSTLPLFVQLMQQAPDNSELFEHMLLRMCEQFMKRLYSVLCICVGNDNAQIFWVQLIRVLRVTIRTNLPLETKAFLSRFLSTDPIPPDSTDEADAQQFVVQRVVNSSEQPATAQAVDNASNNVDTDVEMTDTTTNAATESASASCSAVTTNAAATPSSINKADEASMDDANMEMASAPELPNVVPGTEAWHRFFPNDWLPIISRDIRTQDETPPIEEPYSDAYITGMSAKRRKLIQSNKPADMRSLVEDSVRKAIEATVGNSASSSAMSAASNASPDEIAAMIASDSEVQSSCTEKLRTDLRERLKNDAEYNAEKYPKTTSFINK